jgi:hypothetical protein
MDWPMYRRVEHQAVRIHRMMDRLGVDPLAFARLQQGEAYAEARRRCLFCVAADECLRWLEREVRPGDTPDFCPNLKLFELLRPRTDDALHTCENANACCSAEEIDRTEALNASDCSPTIVRT